MNPNAVTINHLAEANCSLLGPALYVWVQGCPRRCPGCFNSDTLEFDVGVPELSVDEILARWRVHRLNVVLSGGEPMSQAAGLTSLCEALREEAPDLEILAYTGFRMETLLERADPDQVQLLKHLDVLVDGPYVRELPSTMPLVGSRNQRVLLLGRRVSPQRLDELRRPRVHATLAEDGRMTLVGTARGDMNAVVVAMADRGLFVDGQ